MLASLLLCATSIAVAIALLQRQGQSFGLPLAYLISLASIHLPGALVHWLHPLAIAGYNETSEGLAITALAMLAFVAGLAMVGWLKRGLLLGSVSARNQYRQDPRFWRFCASAGLIIGFLLAPLRILPTVGAVIHNASLLWIAGVLLAIRFHTSAAGSPLALQRWIAIGLINPFLSLFGQAFLGYGVNAITQVYCILLVRQRRLFRSLAIVAIAIYLGLGVAVTYMATRNEIRAAVWGGGTTQQRLEAIGNTFTQVGLFDPNDIEHAKLIDLRLNQNFLVGAASFKIQSGRSQLLQGSTVVDALISLVPRALWRDKPISGGSGNLVTNATGILFAEGTSVGIGNVMELYINFGSWGIVVFFSVLGCWLRQLELRAYGAEAVGNYKIYLTSLLPALALIQPGGSLAELTSSMVAAWIAARLWFSLWQRRQRAQQPPSTTGKTNAQQ